MKADLNWAEARLRGLRLRGLRSSRLRGLRSRGRFTHRRLDRQIEKMIQRLFAKATR
jgi:hypothetical protein